MYSLATNPLFLNLLFTYNASSVSETVISFRDPFSLRFRFPSKLTTPFCAGTGGDQRYKYIIGAEYVNYMLNPKLPEAVESHEGQQTACC